MRWLVRDKFRESPLGTCSPLSFWLVARCRSAWSMGRKGTSGIVAGILHSWRSMRTKSPGDLILVRRMTNAGLSAYLLTGGKWECWP
jgi:hypothetical protein